ncbi:hypothetical protein [Erythrobacter sp. EC-HK427]|uniref:hypothetical protein n=1 Tax=Erythrobacter sp. EC-HK427 TaxID=2038396 RepID=UPI00125FB90B|nr:hypothetical protein [Erythrobacter sp. EC-HK427]
MTIEVADGTPAEALLGHPGVRPVSKWENYGDCSNGDRSLGGSQNFSATAFHHLQGDRVSCLDGTTLFVLFRDDDGPSYDQLYFRVNVGHDGCETRLEWELPSADFETKSDAENFATVDRETRLLLSGVSEACGSELRSPEDFGQFQRQVHEIFEVVRRQRDVNARTVDGVIPPHLRN